MTPKLRTAPNAALPDGFLEIPQLVYADDPMWVPERPDDLVSRFDDTANNWFEEGGVSAAFCVPGKARLATFRPPEFEEDEERKAYFGFWETVGDSEADDLLFEAAHGWADAQGADALYGPINFSSYGKYRVRLTNDDDGYTFVGEPYNPPEYGAILEEHGFRPVIEWKTQFADDESAQQMAEARSDVVDRIRDAGFRFEALTPEIWLEHIDNLHGFVDELFGDNFAYTPLSEETFRVACGESFIRKTCPRSSTIVYGPDDDIAGFSLVYPHWGPLIVQEAGDDRVGVSELDYETHWPMLEATAHVDAVLKTTAVAEEYREQGVFTAMLIHLLQNSRGRYDRWYGALIGPGVTTWRFARTFASFPRRYALYAS